MTRSQTSEEGVLCEFDPRHGLLVCFYNQPGQRGWRPVDQQPEDQPIKEAWERLCKAKAAADVAEVRAMPSPVNARGEVNWRSAFAADDGVGDCPKCGHWVGWHPCWHLPPDGRYLFVAPTEIPQQFGDALLLYPELFEDDDPGHEWDNRTTAENRLVVERRYGELRREEAP